MQSLKIVKHLYSFICKFLKKNFKIWILFLTSSFFFSVYYLYFYMYLPLLIKNVPSTTKLNCVLENINIISDVVEKSDLTKHFEWVSYGWITNIDLEGIISVINETPLKKIPEITIRQEEYGSLEPKLKELIPSSNINAKIKLNFLIKLGIIICSFSCLSILSLSIYNNDIV